MTVLRCIGCGIVSRTLDADNWEIFHMHYKCAKKWYPEYYANIRHHGTGGTYLDHEKIVVNSLIVQEIQQPIVK